MAEAAAFLEKLKADRLPMIKVLERRHDEAIKKVLVAAGIPESEHEKEYSVNKDTGDIVRIDTEIDPRLKAAFEKSDNK
jgi:hypothetical protein